MPAGQATDLARVRAVTAHHAAAHRHDRANATDQPWAGLPRAFAGQVRAERQSLAAEIIREIQRDIPEYRRPLTGRFGTGIRLGVQTALQEFADLIEGRANPEERNRVYRALGRGELVEGRSLDALQAAYRLGARVAWRRYARIGRRIGMDSELMITLAEAVFAHIDQIASASVVGYAQAKADAASSIDRRRRQLLELLLRGTPREDLTRAAAEAQWPLPEEVACAVLSPPVDAAAGSRTARWPADVLADLYRPDPYVLLPDPALLLREPAVAQALGYWSAVVGPTVPAAHAADSLRWARRVHEHLGTRRDRGEPLLCDRNLTNLLLLADESLVRLIGERRLGVLSGLTVKQRRRLESTLLVWLATGRASATEVAGRLGVHPQTARQRMRRLQALFGAELSDPQARFELEVALRGRALADDAADG